MAVTKQQHWEKLRNQATDTNIKNIVARACDKLRRFKEKNNYKSKIAEIFWGTKWGKKFSRISHLLDTKKSKDEKKSSRYPTYQVCDNGWRGKYHKDQGKRKKGSCRGIWSSCLEGTYDKERTDRVIAIFSNENIEKYNNIYKLEFNSGFTILGLAEGDKVCTFIDWFGFLRLTNPFYVI